MGLTLYLLQHLKALRVVLKPHHCLLLFGSVPVGSLESTSGSALGLLQITVSSIVLHGHIVEGFTEVHHMSIILLFIRYSAGELLVKVEDF